MPWEHTVGVRPEVPRYQTNGVKMLLLIIPIHDDLGIGVIANPYTAIFWCLCDSFMIDGCMARQNNIMKQ